MCRRISSHGSYARKSINLLAYVYDPLLGAIMRAATAMKVLQAGSLHAYLAYVIVLVVGLVIFVWWQQ